jgi:hypothetical protein
LINFIYVWYESWQQHKGAKPLGKVEGLLAEGMGVTVCG